MAQFVNPVGIVGIEVALPSSLMTLSQMAQLSRMDEETLFEEIGVLKKPVLSTDQSILELALKASCLVLENTQTSPSEVDFVIFASCGVKNKQLWSMAAKIQKELNIPNAFSFDIENGCNSGNLGLNLSQKLLSSSNKHTVLLVVADNLSHTVNYQDPTQACLFNFSDGASAVIIKQNHLHNQILSFSAHTHSQFADHVYIPIDEKKILITSSEEEERALSEEYKVQYEKHIRNVCKDFTEVSRVNHIFMNQGDHRLIDRLNGSLNLDKSVIYRFHEEYGHLGGSDIFFGFKKRLEQNSIYSGQWIVLASSAVGYSWGASLIKA